jgi:predicted PurR-regulated permease PerM
MALGICEEGLMNKENKVILISFVLFLISITATFLIIKNPNSNQYTTVLPSPQSTNKNQSNQNNTHEQSSEQKVITELLNSTSSTIKSFINLLSSSATYIFDLLFSHS